MKAEQSSYKTSHQFLLLRRQEISNSANSYEGTINTLKIITQRVTGGDHVALIVALHNEGYLQKHLNAVKQHYQNKRNEDIERCVSTIYVYAYDCFLKQRPVYKPFFDYFRPRIDKMINKRTYRDFGAENQRYEALERLLKRFEESNDQKNLEPFARGKSLNEFVSKDLAKEVAKTPFEECVLSWLRMQVEEAHGSIVKSRELQDIGFCCNLHFEVNGFRRHVETFTQNFSKELPNRKIQKEDFDQRDAIKRQIVSYLNCSGGIHYVGIDYNVQKETRYFGVTVTEKDRIEVLQYVLNEIVMKTFPSQDENEDEDEKQEEARLEQYRAAKMAEFKTKSTFWEEVEINRYISVQFLPLFNKNTLFYSRSDNKSDVLNFVIRIKVKPGDQYEVYHIINEKDIPEAYFRENNKEKKLTMIEYYNEVYKRLKSKANEVKGDPPKTHTLCRFSLKPKEAGK